MSRTFKDKKKNKIRNGFKREPQLTLHYLNYKQNGFSEDYGNLFCPDCHSSCEYERGYLTCHSCGWGSYAIEHDEMQELEFSRAA